MEGCEIDLIDIGFPLMMIGLIVGPIWIAGWVEVNRLRYGKEKK